MILTRDEIMLLSPAELREAIAEEKGYEQGIFSQEFNPKKYWVTPTRRLTSILPYWTENIADAWELVEEIGNSGDGLPCLIFKSGVDPDDWGKTYWVFELRLFSKGVYKFMSDVIIGYAPTAPLAISRCWLLWKEME